VIDMDKGTGEVEAPASGRLVAITAQEGDAMRPGDVIGEIERT
jgi:pyruvate/2-oxoglutarate dehydrogenase complex dihydrolipoamide acyltransferase (E2) component